MCHAEHSFWFNLASLNMVELASLNMVELASLNMVVDRLVHACWNRLFCCSWLNERIDLNNVVGAIMINQQPCSYMIEHVVRE